MTEYDIIVIKQRRILLSILIMAVAFPLCLLLSAQLELTFIKILFPILALGILTTLLYYFAFGKINITYADKKLNFKWKKKPIFNFKEYQTITTDEITTIIVEEGIYLRKIKTKNSQVELGGIKSKNEDSLKLLKLLMIETNVEPQDSWDVWKERGWLTTFYWINLVVLIIASGIVVTYITLKGFDSKLLLFIPLCLSQLIFGHLQMKSKVK